MNCGLTLAWSKPCLWNLGPPCFKTVLKTSFWQHSISQTDRLQLQHISIHSVSVSIHCIFIPSVFQTHYNSVTLHPALERLLHTEGYKHHCTDTSASGTLSQARDVWGTAPVSVDALQALAPVIPVFSGHATVFFHWICQRNTIYFLCFLDTRQQSVTSYAHASTASDARP